jgi:hypothetical protein
VLVALVAVPTVIALVGDDGPEGGRGSGRGCGTVDLASATADAVPEADARNGQSYIQDNLWTAGDRQYAVWVAPDGTPFAGVRRRCAEGWQQADLSRVPGNPLRAPTNPDPHHVYAVAVDAAGYVHVAGNAHGTPLRSIRSERPGDVTAWRSDAIPGTARSTYPQFARLPDGTLLLFHRAGTSGDGTIELAVLGASGDWQARGPVIDGRPSGESPYLHRVAVDPRTGAVHLLFEWRGSEAASTTNDVSYVRSLDGAVTWETSGGHALERPVTHATAESVVDTTPEGSGLLNGGGLAVDRDGLPHSVVTFGPPDRAAALEHVWHDGERWRRESLAAGGLGGRPTVAATPDGRVWAIGTADGRLAAIDLTAGSGRQIRAAAVPGGWEVTFDSQAVVLDGSVQTLVPDGDEPRVVALPLP